jgi:hypothetical protein
VVLRFEARRGRRRRPSPLAPERLEGRDLPAYSPLGFSPPNLSVSGFAAPATSYGGPLSVTINLTNTGNETLVEPLAALGIGTGTATSAPTNVVVYISPRRRLSPGVVPIGTVDFPSVPQAGVVQETANLTLPPLSKLPGFPTSGHKIYLYFATPNKPLTPIGVPVLVSPNLPDLRTVNFSTPPQMQPGDVIAPSIRVGNYGTVDTSTQGPVQVEIVASPTRDFSTSSVVASYTLSDIPPVSVAPTFNFVVGDTNLDPSQNIATITSPPITLPPSSQGYFIGVVVDPAHHIRQIKDVVSKRGPVRTVDDILPVSAPLAGLPPAGVVAPPSSLSNLFPTPPGGPINQATTSTTTVTITPANGGQSTTITAG